MAFFEHRLSDNICSGSRGGPVWSTTRVVTAGGWRQANRDWSAPLHRYDVTYGIKTEDDYNEIRAMHFVVGGAADGFRFKDFADYRVAAADGVLQHVSGNVYQLGKAYRIGARAFTRKIAKPVAGSVVLYVDGVESATATVDPTTGLATFTAPPADGAVLTWSGEFDVPVSFADDTLDAEWSGPDNRLLLGTSSLKLEEIRL